MGFAGFEYLLGWQTQYYVAVSGQSALYIGTYITAEPSIGELRFIARLNADLLTGSTASNARGKYLAI